MSSSITPKIERKMDKGAGTYELGRRATILTEKGLDKSMKIKPELTGNGMETHWNA